MHLNGSQIIIECLKEQGVDTVFGYPGGAILNVYDELYKHPEIRHILTSHEQGAAHAADGYARATGKVGVCFATSGPGATNLVTGIATAYMDSVPLVAITANVGTSFLGKDSFQEIDITGVAMPITKYSTIVKDIAQLADTLRRAFEIARSGRPGPVLVDVPKDITAAVCAYAPQHPSTKPDTPAAPSEEELARAAELIALSERPYLMVGGGTVLSEAHKEVAQLAHLLDAPVCETLMGRGAFPSKDPLFMGMLGMHGTKGANLLIGECDLLIVLGARFSDRDVGSPSTFASQAKILQIDIDPAEINKNVVVTARVQGDMRDVLQRLLPRIAQKHSDAWEKERRAKQAFWYAPVAGDCLTGPFVVQKTCEVTKGEAIICTDVGQHQMWASQYYDYEEPRQLITSGGLGTMGYGLGASIGAKIGRPDKTVINFTGDGCFRMNMNELITAVRHQVPVIDIVINNHVLGMVRQWQTLFYGRRYSATVFNDPMDFVQVAKGMGADAVRITKPEAFVPALQAAIASGRPTVLDCWIDPDEKVAPMIPAGHRNDEIYDEKDLEHWGD